MLPAAESFRLWKKWSVFFRTLFHHKSLFVDSSSKIGNTHVASHKPPILPKKLREGFAVLVLRNDPLLGLLYRQIPTSVGETYLLVQTKLSSFVGYLPFLWSKPQQFSIPLYKNNILNPKTQEITKIIENLCFVDKRLHPYPLVSPWFNPSLAQGLIKSLLQQGTLRHIAIGDGPEAEDEEHLPFCPEKNVAKSMGNHRKSWEITQNSSFNGPLESGRKLNGPLFRDVWYVNPFWPVASYIDTHWSSWFLWPPSPNVKSTSSIPQNLMRVQWTIHSPGWLDININQTHSWLDE